MLTSTWRTIDAPDADAFARNTLFAASRKRPIVALTTSGGERRLSSSARTDLE